MVVIACGITASLKPEDKTKLMDRCTKLAADLNAGGVRATTDLRENYSPGWKFNHWELKGVPIRAEIGPRDLESGKVVCVRRHNGVKSVEENNDGVVGTVQVGR